MSIPHNVFMSPDEIKIEAIFKDNSGKNIIIQAGDNGYVIIYYSKTFDIKHQKDTWMNNYNNAIKAVNENVSNLQIIYYIKY